MKTNYLIALGITFFSLTSFAQPAANCVRISSANNAQRLTNVCNTKIEVVWCHELNRQGYRSGLCGHDGKFYQKHHVLNPGESTQNKYSLPLGTRIHYGACTGSYYSTKVKGMSDRYSCI